MSRSGEPAALAAIPEFAVKPDRIGAFLALAQDDARHSVADGPGCRRFGVARMEGAPSRVLFHEAHDSRAAFEAHTRTPHPARFREGFPALALEERPARSAGRRHG